MRKSVVKLLLMLFAMQLLLSSCGQKQDPLVIQRDDTSHMHTTPQTVDVSGCVYYVSPMGDDANDGLSEGTALKTIHRVNQIELQPGDAVLFQCGGIYGDACLELTASGTPAQHILISWYGTGEYPILRGGENEDEQYVLQEDRTATVAIKLTSAHCVTLRGLHMDGANFGVFMNNAKDNDFSQSQLAVEDCVFTNIGGYHCLARTETAPTLPPFYSNAIEIALRGKTPLTLFSITDSVFVDCEAAMHIDTNTQTIIQNVRVENMLREGILFESCHAAEDAPSLVENVTLENVGTVLGKDWGTAAIQWNVCSNFICDALDISYTGNGEYRTDMVGGDYEATNKNIIVKNSRIHNNGGVGWLIYATPGWGKDNSNISLVDNVFANNGLVDDYTPAVLKHYYNENAGGQITGNQIYLAYPVQYLHFVDAGNTNEWPGSYTLENNQVMGVYQPDAPALPENCICSIDFDDAYNYDAWYAYTNVKYSYMNGKYLTSVIDVTEAGEEIAIMSKKKLDLDLSGAKKMTIRLKNKSQATSMKIYFAGADGKFTDACIVIPMETMNDGFVEYTVDISSQIPSLGQVQRIKIIPAVDVTEGWMQYDYIRFFK